MSNWAENPVHQRQSLMNYTLPHLLFQECHKYCVNNSELRVAETASELSCITNCQAKTYTAFDIFMQVQQRVVAKKTARSYVDVSRFTDMEIEHQHDTASEINHDVGQHITATNTNQFNKVVDQIHGDIKKEALQ